MTTVLIAAAKKRKALALRKVRPVTLTWPGSDPVLAREGVSQQAQEFVEGGMLVRQACKFYVLREVLPVAPDIGTVFWIDGRPTVAWRLDRVRGGTENDVEWIFECVEEHRG